MSIVFRRLALGGGGVKGILHIGVLQELKKHQELYFPDGVYGCSIGSIIGTYVAFGLPVDSMVPLLQKYLHHEKIVPKPELSHLSNCFSGKGMFTMDMFENTIKEMFLEVGLNIEGKTLNDAKMPLHIVASNITKRVPAVLSGNVSVLSALKCSCCLPAIFKPQELYDSLYIDGDIFSPCIASIVPINETTLVVSLMKQGASPVTTKNIEKMTPLDFVGNLYLMMMIQFYKAQQKPNILQLKYPGLYSTSKLEDIDLNAVFQYSSDSLLAFISESSLQKRSE